MEPAGFRIITRSKVVITSLKFVIMNLKGRYYDFLIKIIFLLMAPIELRNK